MVSTTPVFATKHRELLGKQHPGYVAVLGIPCAAPPVGDLRFRPPQEPIPWDGVRDGRIFGAVSLQACTDYDPAQGSERSLVSQRVQAQPTPPGKNRCR